MHLLKKIILGFLVVSLSTYTFQPIWAAFETEQTVETRIDKYCTKLKVNRQTFAISTPTDYTKIPFTKLKTAYHQDINQLFAEEIQKIISVSKEQQKIQTHCSDQNITQKINTTRSSYELSQKGLCRFALYQYALNIKLKDPNIPSEILKKASNTQLKTFQALSSYQESIRQELLLAQKSFNETLAIYEEMRYYFPLHLRLQCIIAEIENFRLQLGELVDLFFFMEKYINAASDQFE